MWEALGNLHGLVKPGGLLFIAIYNDMGRLSRLWLARKRRYNAMPGALRTLYAWGLWLTSEFHLAGGYLRANRFGEYLDEILHYHKRRGMSRYHDALDWIGGYPYEFARAHELVEFFGRAGFSVRKLIESQSTGCHQIVFQKRDT
jgi:hypothetical protein